MADETLQPAPELDPAIKAAADADMKAKILAFAAMDENKGLSSADLLTKLNSPVVNTTDKTMTVRNEKAFLESMKNLVVGLAPDAPITAGQIMQVIQDAETEKTVSVTETIVLPAPINQILGGVPFAPNALTLDELEGILNGSQ